jgi:histidinol-phosphate aminotransferase
MDLLSNPFGPSIHAIEALSGADDLHTPHEGATEALRARLAARLGLRPEWICLANGTDEIHGMIARWRRSQGPFVTFTPTDLDLERWIAAHGVDLVRFRRAADFSLPLTTATPILPKEATTVVLSPNNPTGTAVGLHETIRLLRQSALVVIDERHAAFGYRSLAPLVREFDNLIIVQTMETGAGLSGVPLAWAIAPPKLTRSLARHTRPAGIARGGVLASLATLDDMEYVDATIRRVTAERSRLFRTLRKLSMISSPYPSWANFLLARIERGTAPFFAEKLATRGIFVHLVEHPDLANHLRISPTNSAATNALKDALIDIALEL